VLDPGFGVVHRLEPSQIVSFSNNTDVLKDVAVEDNHKVWQGSQDTFYKILVKKDKGTLLVKNFAKRAFQKQNFSVGDTLVLERSPYYGEDSVQNISLTVVRLLQRGLLVLFGEDFFAITANAWSYFDGDKIYSSINDRKGSYYLQQTSLKDFLDDDYEDEYPLAERVTPEEDPEYFED